MGKPERLPSNVVMLPAFKDVIVEQVVKQKASLNC